MITSETDMLIKLSGVKTNNFNLTVDHGQKGGWVNVPP